MAHNNNSSIKRSHSSPTILEPDKRQKLNEQTPPPPPNTYFNQHDHSPVEIENDVDPTGQENYDVNVYADIEDNPGSEYEDTNDNGSENDEEE